MRFKLAPQLASSMVGLDHASEQIHMSASAAASALVGIR